MKKTIFLFAALLLTAYSVADDVVVGNQARRDSTLQERGIEVKNYTFQPGDTIIITKDTKTYLTGEEISEWVYYVRHIVQQNGGKRFPNGILLQGIYSWVEPQSLLLLRAQESTPAAQAKEKENRPQVDQRRREMEQMEEEQRRAITEEATRRHTEPVVRPQEQPAVQPQEQPAVRPTEPVQPAVIAPAVIEKHDNEARETVRQEGVARQEAETRRVQPAQQVTPAVAVVPVQADQKVQETAPVQEVKPLQDATPAQDVKPTQDQQPVQERLQPMEKEKENAPEVVKSEIDRFSIGLRGGVASMLHQTTDAANGNWKPGFDVLLDLQYAHYWQQGTAPSMGILTGLSVGYDRSIVTSKYDTVMPITTDADGDQVQYTLSGNAREVDGQVILEVPLMFSLVTNNGFFFNVGPRFQLPVYNHFKQTITDGNISLYNITKGVTVANEAVIGELTADQKTWKASEARSKFNILLSAELGYEWRLHNNNSVGLGVYANYGLTSLYNNTASGQLFTVGTPDQLGGKANQVDVFTTTAAYTEGNGFKLSNNNGLGFFDCGVKLNYNFNWIKR